MLAIYLCYIVLLLLIPVLNNEWIYEWTEWDKHFNYGNAPVVHTLINVRTLVNFIIWSIIPLGIYWIVRLFAKAPKENN